MQGDLALECEFGERGYVVDDAVREIGCRSDDENGVAVDEAGHAGDVNLVRGRWAGHQVDLDTEVFASLLKSCVSGAWEDPRSIWLAVGSQRVLHMPLHFWFGNPSFRMRLLPCAQTSHENRLGTSTRSNARCTRRRIEHS